MSLGFPSAHVESHFTYQRLGNHDVNAVDSRQIHSRDALQFIGEGELWIILVLFALLFRGFFLFRLWRNRIRKTSQVFL